MPERSSFQIRIAVIAEAPGISLVLRKAFAEYEALYSPAAFAATTPTTEQIRARWHEGPVWIALNCAAAVGTIAAVPQGDALYVRSMAILPNARGKGTGRELLQQVENYARVHGFRRLSLSTTPFLERAIRLYEQSGFRKTDAGPKELFGTPLFTMEKNLDAMRDQ